jgi:hypothetical protein
MMEKQGPDRFLRIVLIANGIGDIALAVLILFLPGLLARILGLGLTDDLRYVAGGWGTAAAAFGTLRVCAGTISRSEIGWFVGAFGVFEGVLLTAFGLVIPAMTSLRFGQVWLSTLFASIFAVAYGIAFLWRRASIPKPGTESLT